MIRHATKWAQLPDQPSSSRALCSVKRERLDSLHLFVARFALMTPADVKRLRFQLNWTQDEMGDYLGISRSTVSRYETDIEVAGPALKLLDRLADEFNRGRRRTRTTRRRPLRAIAPPAAAE
jgi:DNA-binding transcriptional regulator YiaG